MLIGLGQRIRRSLPQQATDKLYIWGRNFGYGNGIGSIDEAFISSEWHVLDWDQNITQVTSGQHSYGVILADGTLYVWGASAPSGKVASPELVPGTWKQVQVGGDPGFGMGIDVNDDLYVWGANDNYKTGLGISTGRTTTPTQLMAGTKFLHISAFVDGGFAITSNNDLFSFGNNALGATGQGTATGYTTGPTQVGTLKWKDVEASRDNALGITTDGTLYGWGSDRNDANGHTTQQNSPVAVSGIPACDRLVRRAKEISSLTPNGVFATNGDLWVFGSNAQGQIFPPTTTNKAKTNMGSGWKDFYISSVCSMGIDQSDQLWHIGYASSDGTTVYFPLANVSPNQTGVQQQYIGVDYPIRLVAAAGTRIVMVPA